MGFRVARTPAERQDAHREIAARYARRPRHIDHIRLAEINRLLDHRWGDTVPDDDAGESDLFCLLVATAMASATGIMERMVAVARYRAPHLGRGRTLALVQRIIERGYRYGAAGFGRELGLRYGERKALRITTIRACDLTPQEVAARQADARRIKRRERDGSVDRETYLRRAEARREAIRTAGVSASSFAKWPRERREAAIDAALALLYPPAPERTAKVRPEQTSQAALPRTDLFRPKAAGRVGTALRPPRPSGTGPRTSRTASQIEEPIWTVCWSSRETVADEPFRLAVGTSWPVYRGARAVRHLPSLTSVKCLKS